MADNPTAQGFWSRAANLAWQPLAPNHQGVLLASWDGHGPLQLSVPHEAQAMGARLQTLQHFAAAAALALVEQRHRPVRFAVQVHDESPTSPGFRFDAACDEADSSAAPLIPDPYVLGSWGYASLRAAFEARQLPPWEQRLPLAFWRGSSTGGQALTPRRLPGLPRYQLCQRSLWRPDWIDARFSAVVQARDRQAAQAVVHQLQHQGLLAPRCEPWDAALHRWLLEIDGNVNSWGLLWKLLSGACVLRVQSSRRQWYHQRLQPWQHVVPVAADLSDLMERLHWCRNNPAASAAIAAAGQALAERVVADLELDMLAAVHRFDGLL